MCNTEAERFGIRAVMEEMAAEVKRLTCIGPQGEGFVARLGNPFPLDTNPRLIDTVVATAHLHGAGGPVYSALISG